MQHTIQMLHHHSYARLPAYRTPLLLTSSCHSCSPRLTLGQVFAAPCTTFPFLAVRSGDGCARIQLELAAQVTTRVVPEEHVHAKSAQVGASKAQCVSAVNGWVGEQEALVGSVNHALQRIMIAPVNHALGWL